ncbi:MAG: 5-(carboxyamino)imidazole ribonucleotide mutase [Bifidobacteriaceae bacterium]|jgi:5-(carboxyamino)imidazole ribonucleotide mutase|nr:5-(carboxyamino)imidazole ribonucleotide mutase [Bifidobacteriaceae bacterium]
MGSKSDLPVMEKAAGILKDLGVGHEVNIISAHRLPDETIAYGRAAAARGLRVIIAGAGGAAALPGMLAAVTTLPVVGVPIATAGMNGLDAVLSMVQMPSGVPVATVAIDGATNSGLLAARIIASGDDAEAAAVRQALDGYRQGRSEELRTMSTWIQTELQSEAGQL